MVSEGLRYQFMLSINFSYYKGIKGVISFFKQ